VLGDQSLVVEPNKNEREEKLPPPWRKNVAMSVTKQREVDQKSSPW